MNRNKKLERNIYLINPTVAVNYSVNICGMLKGEMLIYSKGSKGTGNDNHNLTRKLSPFSSHKLFRKRNKD